MDGRPTWTNCNEAGDYVVPNVFSPRDLVFRPDNMDETVPHTRIRTNLNEFKYFVVFHFELLLSLNRCANNVKSQIDYKLYLHYFKNCK